MAENTKILTAEQESQLRAPIDEYVGAIQEKINAMDEASYAQYLRYHFYTCEKPEHLGASNHLLFVGKA